MSDRCSVLLMLLVSLVAATGATAAPPETQRMTLIVGKDVSGSIYRKIGLPSRQYCWDSCLKDDRCTGVRWGVVDKDTAGLCILMTGELALKDLVAPRTEDGKPIHVVAARKESSAVTPEY